jgi:hypothetical protein
MKQPILFGYQLLTGLSDATTGVMLIIVPKIAMDWMHLHIAADALPFLSFIGSFVFAVGLCCLYGGYLVFCEGCSSKLSVVWFLTAIIRCSVALFVFLNILSGTLEAGWMTVAIFDGACAVTQGIGLRRGWLLHAAA